MKTLKNLLAKIHRDETGAMAVEKILLLALVAIPIILLLIIFKDRIIGWFNEKADQLDPGT